MESLKCPNCGANLTSVDDAMFCPYCGIAIPKVKEKSPITINQTNQYTTNLQYKEPRTALDKFLDHRKEMKVIKSETKITREEERPKKQEADEELIQRVKEAEALAEIEKQKRIAEQEKRKHEISRKRITARITVAVLIPICFLLFHPPIIPIIISALLIIVCCMI